MDVKALAEQLKKMYNNAPPKEQVVFIHLFGIKYGELILKNNLNIAEIVSASGINDSYKTEVRKGVNLSRYVSY